MNPIYLYLSVFLGVVSAYVLVYYFLRRQLRIRLLLEVDHAIKSAVEQSLSGYKGPQEDNDRDSWIPTIPVKESVEKDIAPELDEAPIKDKRRKKSRRQHIMEYDLKDFGGISRSGRKVSSRDIIAELEDQDT